MARTGLDRAAGKTLTGLIIRDTFHLSNTQSGTIVSWFQLSRSGVEQHRAWGRRSGIIFSNRGQTPGVAPAGV